MSKFISVAAQQAIEQRTGISPVLLVSVLWGYDLRWYSSRECQVPGIVTEPRIRNAGQISCDKKADNKGSAGSFDFTLSDPDSVLKFYLENTVAEKTKATVWLWIDGTGFDDRILLLDGYLGTPSWSDEDRTASFRIESPTEKQEIGVAPTRQDFNDLSKEAEGIAWPLLFGTVSNVPCVRAKQKASGALLTDIQMWGKGYYTSGNKVLSDDEPKIFSYVPDGTDGEYVENKILIDNGENFPQNKKVTLNIAGIYIQGSFIGNVFTVETANYPKYQAVKLKANNYNRADVFVKGSQTSSTDQGPDYSKIITLANPKLSLANTFCYFVVGTKKTMNYCTKQVDDMCYFKWPMIDPVTRKSRELGPKDMIQEVYTIAKNGLKEADLERHFTEMLLSKQYADAELLEGATRTSDAFWSADSGTVISLTDFDDPDLYIASATKLTSITSVVGKRNLKLSNGKIRKTLTQIPTIYYEKMLESNFTVNKSKVSGLLFHTPLSEYQGQEWEDIVYISGQSSVGPNPVDIIRYALTKYTDLHLDWTFNSVHAKVSGLPANFAIFDRRNALQFAHEVAWQSMCALNVNSNLASITYLAEYPNVIMNFDESNIDEATFEISFTETNEVVTRLSGSWTDTYKDSPQPQNLNTSAVRDLSKVLKALMPDTYREQTATKIYTYRENIDLYGLNSIDESIYIYNNEASVKKVIDFWGHRMANVWKIVSFSTSDLRALMLQTFDGIYVSVNSNDITMNTVAVIESVRYDPGKKQVSIKAWTPIVAGSPFEDGRAFNA